MSVTVPPVAKRALQVEPQEIATGLEVTVPVAEFRLVRATVSAETAVKVAVTFLDVVMDTEQVPVPAQAPDHPEKTDPLVGEAASVTEVPPGNVALQVAPHEIPAGDEVTVPAPVPDLLTVSTWPVDAKVATTPRAAVIATVQVEVPEQPSPLQPTNVEPAAGVAVSVTEESPGNTAEQVEPQLMPAGDEATVPDPVPAFVTVTVGDERTDPGGEGRYSSPAPYVLSGPAVPRSTTAEDRSQFMRLAGVAFG